jgi:hypothetical protein
LIFVVKKSGRREMGHNGTSRMLVDIPKNLGGV